MRNMQTLNFSTVLLNVLNIQEDDVILITSRLLYWRINKSAWQFVNWAYLVFNSLWQAKTWSLARYQDVIMSSLRIQNIGHFCVHCLLHPSISSLLFYFATSPSLSLSSLSLSLSLYSFLLSISYFSLTPSPILSLTFFNTSMFLPFSFLSFFTLLTMGSSNLRQSWCINSSSTKALILNSSIPWIA